MFCFLMSDCFESFFCVSHQCLPFHSSFSHVGRGSVYREVSAGLFNQYLLENIAEGFRKLLNSSEYFLRFPKVAKSSH